MKKILESISIAVLLVFSVSFVMAAEENTSKTAENTESFVPARGDGYKYVPVGFKILERDRQGIVKKAVEERNNTKWEFFYLSNETLFILKGISEFGETLVAKWDFADSLYITVFFMDAEGNEIASYSGYSSPVPFLLDSYKMLFKETYHGGGLVPPKLAKRFRKEELKKVRQKKDKIFQEIAKYQWCVASGNKTDKQCRRGLKEIKGLSVDRAQYTACVLKKGKVEECNNLFTSFLKNYSEEVSKEEQTFLKYEYCLLGAESSSVAACEEEFQPFFDNASLVWRELHSYLYDAIVKRAKLDFLSDDPNVRVNYSDMYRYSIWI